MKTISHLAQILIDFPLKKYQTYVVIIVILSVNSSSAIPYKNGTEMLSLLYLEIYYHQRALAQDTVLTITLDRSGPQFKSILSDEMGSDISKIVKLYWFDWNRLILTYIQYLVLMKR